MRKSKNRPRCVYGIFSDTNELKYVGQCYVDLLQDRLRRHKREKERFVNFNKWKWLKKNPDAYIAALAGPFSNKNDANQEERRYISEYKDSLLNLSPGGDYNPMLDPIHRERIIRRIRETRTGKPLSDAHRNAISSTLKGQTSPRKGVVLSEATKKKISLGVSTAQKGRKLSLETRRKISEARKRWWAGQRQS